MQLLHSWAARILVAATWTLFFTCSVAWGQATAQINGSVKDPSGLAVPGADIKVTQTATGLVRTTTSGADGGYVFTNLPIGPYLLEISKQGFAKYVQSGIVLQVDSNPTIDAALRVGAVTEQVQVQADAALVETQSTGVGQVVDSQRVVEMPLNGRNATELIFLAGMANTASGTGSIMSVRNYPTVLVSVAGGVGGGLTYLLDGANFNDVWNNLNLPLPFPDALQEFKVETSALPAQYGMHAGGAVNAVTKSGTNQFHGDLFEFLRNGDLNSRDFFATARDTLRRNQFGGTIGGPIVKDKLFFFAGLQDTIQKSAPAQNVAYVPTALEEAGDFTVAASPECNGGKQLTLASSVGFTNNTISPTLVNPVALNFAKLLPVPSNPCGEVIYGFRSNQTEYLGVGRMDYQKSARHSLFLRATSADLYLPSTYNSNDPLTINTTAANYGDYSIAAGDTYLIGSNMVSTFRVTVSATEIPKPADNFTTWAALGSNVSPIAPGELEVSVTGNGFGVGGGSAAQNRIATGPNAQASEDISFIKGNHQLGFGVNFLHQTARFVTYLRAPGDFIFNGQATGLPMADFLIGTASGGFNQGNVAGWNERQNIYEVYVQDSWKLKPGLTLNYGIRYEPYLPPSSKYNNYVTFSPPAFANNIHGTTYLNAPAGLFVPGDPQYPFGGAPDPSKLNTWAPRVGLVWDPTGSGRMTIRAAYGIFNDRQYFQSYSAYGTNAPQGDNITLPTANLSNPWATYPGGNPIPVAVNKNEIFPLSASYVFADPGFKPTYMNQWNLSIQRQIGQDWLVTANYLGNSMIHLVTGNQINPAVFLGLGPCTLQTVNSAGQVVPTSYSVCSTQSNLSQRRVLYMENPLQGQYYAGMNDKISGTGTYDGLVLTVQHRLSHNVSALANYTLSHCINDYFEPQLGIANAVNLPGDARAYRSNCVTSDQRQVFNLSMVAQTPKFSNSNRALRWIARDWQISPIISVKSAQFFSVDTGVDGALTGQSMEEPNLVPGVSPYVSNSSCPNAPCVRWITSAAFSAPATGTYGNLGLNNLKGPGVVQVDVAFSRIFPVTESKTLQFRADAFNLPNRVNLNPPNTAFGAGSAVAPLNSGTFGTITSDISGTQGLTAGDPRIVQLVLKFVF
jgi:Carboxypeptidase regulatory-like domain/TonB dependent receptor